VQHVDVCNVEVSGSLICRVPPLADRVFPKLADGIGLKSDYNERPMRKNLAWVISNPIQLVN
jgi:hypothetical protein